MNYDKVTVYIPTDKWLRGETGAWGNGTTGGCANTFVQKSQGVIAGFGPHASRLDRTVMNEIIKINDNKTTPDEYKKGALQTLLEPYGITLKFVDPPKCETPQPQAVIDGEADLTTT